MQSLSSSSYYRDPWSKVIPPSHRNHGRLAMVQKHHGSLAIDPWNMEAFPCSWHNHEKLSMAHHVP